MFLLFLYLSCLVSFTENFKTRNCQLLSLMPSCLSNKMMYISPLSDLGIELSSKEISFDKLCKHFYPFGHVPSKSDLVLSKK